MERRAHRTRTGAARRGRPVGNGGERRCVADGGESGGGKRAGTLQHIVGQDVESAGPGPAFSDRAHGTGSGVLSIAVKVTGFNRNQLTRCQLTLVVEL